MKIRKANIADLEDIMNIYKSCVSGMIKRGIDQWDKKYPNIKIIKSDIKLNTYYVAEKNGELIAGVNIDKIQDIKYKKIRWSKNSFLVIHRLAVKENYWRHKIGKNLMYYAESLAQNYNLESIRLDTYCENPIAISFYKKLNYKQLGHIYLKADKNEYYCFEKIIK